MIAIFKNLSATIFLQCFFTINHILILILGSILGYYFLGVEFKYLATLPPALMLISAFIFIPLARKILDKYGHKTGFFIGSSFGLLGAIAFYYAVLKINFSYLLLATIFFGIHQSYAGFLRYVAADDKPCCKKTQAVAAVILGSILATILTPLLIQYTENMYAVISYLGTAVAIIGINIIGLCVSLLVKNNKNHDFKKQNKIGWRDLPKFKGFKTGTSLALIANAIMHFLMLATPLAIIGCGLSVNEVSLAVQIHVIAMLLPAFIIGTLLQKLGLKTTLFMGVMCFLITLPFFNVGYQTSQIIYFQIGMISMGLGWGILYITSTGIIALCYCPCDASGIQTKAEMIIVGGSGILSFLAGFIYYCWNWQGILYITMLLLAIALIIIIMENKYLVQESENRIVNQTHSPRKFKVTITNH